MSESPAERQLQQARQALEDAIGAREAGLSDAVVINRLYYTCFHAAQAVLYDRDFEPDSMVAFSRCSDRRSSWRGTRPAIRGGF